VLGHTYLTTGDLKMKTKSVIAYAYPTSKNAEDLGVPKTGGHYIQQCVMCEDGNWSLPYIHQGHDVFSTPDDPDLWALLKEIRRGIN